MKSKLFLLLTLLGVLGLMAPRALAQAPKPATGTITITTALKVGDRMNLIVVGPDGSSKSVEIAGAKAVPVEGKIAYEITSKPITVKGDIRSFEITMSQVKNLKFENCVNLKTLICGTNLLDYLDLSGLSALEYLNCTSSNINTIKLDGCTSLKEIRADANKLKSINLAAAPKLETVSLPINALTEINLDGVSCKDLDLSSNNLTSLDLSKTTGIERISVSTNPLTSINLKGCTDLETLSAKNTKIGEIDLSGLTELSNVDLHAGKLSKITFKDNGELTDLDLSENQLTAIDLKECPKIAYLSLNHNALPEMHLDGLDNLKNINLRKNKLTNFSIKDCPELNTVVLSDNLLTSTDLTGGKASLRTVYVDGNQLTTLDLTGFAKLETLSAGKNQITEVKLDGCEKLSYVDLSENKLSALTFPGLPDLSEIYIQSNSIQGDAMTNLIKSLPKKKASSLGTFAGSLYALRTRSGNEQNRCLKADVKAAHDLGWGIYDKRPTKDEKTGKIEERWVAYNGAAFCKITTKTVGEGGSIKINGQTSLDNVYTDTKVTITSDHKDGYALKSLVLVFKGDSVNIFNERYFYAPDVDAEVVATFTNDICKVILKKLGKGVLKLNGDGLDTRGLPRGMEIEVVAGAEDEFADWQLGALTMRKLKTGGKPINIMGSKSFTLEEDTEIFAEYQNTNGGAVPTDTAVWDGEKWLGVIMPTVPSSEEAQLYPNPATDFVTVAGAQPATTVNVYTLSGSLVASYATNREGYAELTVADLPEGAYIVLIGNDPRKLIIRR